MDAAAFVAAFPRLSRVVSTQHLFRWREGRSVLMAAPPVFQLFASPDPADRRWRVVASREGWVRCRELPGPAANSQCRFWSGVG